MADDANKDGRESLPATPRPIGMFSDNELAVATIMQKVNNRYFSTERDDGVLAGIKFVLGRSLMNDANGEANVFCVTGKSGAGKTRTIERVIMRTLKLENYKTPTCPIAYLSAPGPCTLKQLGRNVLTAVGYPLIADRREHLTWELARKKLKQNGAIALHIDEMQNATSRAKKDEAQRIIDMLKTLLVTRPQPVGLILSGTTPLAEFLRRDIQIERRTRFYHMPSMDPRSSDDHEVIRAAITALTEIAGLKFSEHGHVVARVMHAARYEFGMATQLARWAIEIALLNKDRTLTIQHFAAEHAARDQNASSPNPFLAHDWSAITHLDEN